MAIKLTRATDADREAYRTRPGAPTVYPAYGFVVISGQRCVIEDLRGTWRAPDPVYEIMAPTGWHFDFDYTHSLLCHDLADVRERASYAALIPCTGECDAGG